MSVKEAVRDQYQSEVDLAYKARFDRLPPEGWIRTLRKAIGMSAAQLARRMGVTRARIAQAERAELEGGVTLKSMEAMAEAMGCKFVYGFVPPGSVVENVVIERARAKAGSIVASANKHMALEGQAVTDERTEQETGRIFRALMVNMPSDLWDD